MGDISVSIIIPVYNAEKYLQETLDSIVAQTFRDFEVILVNDGSKDNSLKIMQEIQDKMSNVVIHNQVNLGVSAARNNGLKLVRGEYVCFVDSDDILHREYLEKMHEMTGTGVDAVLCEYDVFYNVDQISIKKIETKEPEDLCCRYKGEVFDYIMDLGLGTSPCIKMYRTELIKKYNVMFDEKSTYGEDMFFNWKFFLVASSVYYIKSKLYFYRQSMISTTMKFHPNLFESYAREYQSVRDFAEHNNIDMVKLEKSISRNLIKRIPSFLRMNMRRKGGLCKKMSGVKELVNKQEIQNAISEYEKQEKLSKELTAIKNRKYLRVFFQGCFYEYRFRIARFIKNLV